MKPLRTLCVCTLSAALAGCPPGDGGSPPGPPLGKMPGLEKARADGKNYILFVLLQIVTFEVPVGAASQSEQIWSYLDEEPIGVQRGVSLGRNGIRVGLGRQEDWPDRARLLKQMTGRRTRETTVTLLPGDPKSIVLKKKQPLQTVFTFYGDRTYSGADYPPGDNLLTFVCTLNEDDLSTVRITVLPQIRSSHRRPQVVGRGQGMMIVERPVLYSFHPLLFQASVPKGGVLVIGPNDQSRRPHSAGRSFLVNEKRGIPFETVQVLLPNVYASPPNAKATP